MASLVARALTEDPPKGKASDPRRGVDRVLLSTFWRPTRSSVPAPVIPITTTRRGPRTPPSRG